MCPMRSKATTTTATTIAVFVAVKDGSTYYKYTLFKLQNSIYVFY